MSFRSFSNLFHGCRTVLMCLGMGTLLCQNALAGYTHYFTWHQPPDTSSLTQCVAEMRLLIEARHDVLVGPNRPEATPGKPTVGTTNVDINGIGENAHEPFGFPGEVGFNFCKTAFKPYDEVVTACLLVARDHFPPRVLSIQSDGSWEDWTDGVKLYSSVLRRRPKNPFKETWAGDPMENAVTLFFCAVLLGVAFVLWKKSKPRLW